MSYVCDTHRVRVKKKNMYGWVRVKGLGLGLKMKIVTRMYKRKEKG